MMGNVKEWCFNDAGGGHRFILGGGCGEPIYMPLTLDSGPGAMDGRILPRMRPLADGYGLDALVRSGRAVLWPVFHGTYERRFASSDDERGEEEERIDFGQDLMRAILSNAFESVTLSPHRRRLPW